MHAIVPAAGEGTRLRPLTNSRPKGLLEVDGRPILAHCFDRLIEVDVETIVVVIGYFGDRIVDHFGDRYRETKLTYVYQEEQLGLGHAVAQVAGETTGDVLVCNGDNVFGTSFEPVVDTHSRADVDATLLVEEVSRSVATQTGVVTTDRDGRVTGLVEKPADPPSTLATTGVYALPPSIFEHVRSVQPSARGEIELVDAIDRLRRDGATIGTVELDGWRINVNTRADLEAARRTLADHESAER